MCKDLGEAASDYAIWQTCDLDIDNIIVGKVKEMIAEAYKQGYCDALPGIGHNGLPMADDFELVEQTDKKTAFLSELKELLERYDAEITFGCDHEYKTIETTITIGDTKIVRKEVYGVNEHNVMDFDKD